MNFVTGSNNGIVSPEKGIPQITVKLAVEVKND